MLKEVGLKEPDIIRVLVIDDNDVDRERIRRSLRRNSGTFSLTEADSLKNGIALANSQPVDVVVLDLTLQETTGLQTLSTFRESVPNVPIVLVSGIADEQMALDSIRNGAEDFIPKDGFENQWFRIVLRNAIERFELKNQLGEYAKKLELANEDLGQFVYVASHDLQEPLRAVKGYGTKLLKETNNTKQPEWTKYLGKIIEGAERMSRLINDLLRYSHHTVQDNEYRAIDLASCVAVAQKNLARAIEESRASITVTKLPVILGDHSQLIHLFQNLIGNAIKYVAPGTLPQITIRSELSQNEIEIYVTDNGIGIEQEFHSQIFGVFKRLHRRDEYTGTGIGLAICKKVVERHHGKLTLKSEPGTGTTFCARFPRSSLAESVKTE